MANISLFDPMTAQMNRLLQNFGLKPFHLEDDRLQMKLDVSENENNFIVRADIPGIKKEDIKVDIDGNRVSISGEMKSQKEEKKDEKVIYSERYEGRVYRSFTLDSAIDDAKAQANYKDGVLELTLPKSSNGKVKRLAIN
ncbi:MAG: Hsp20/alpha crystallin family protein [Spongiibacteraceae bacterium]